MKENPLKEWYRPDEVAALYSISVKTVYCWISEGKLEACRIGNGKTVRIHREAVETLPKPTIQ